MSGGLNQGGYYFPNVYGRSIAARQRGDWNTVREEGFEAPPVYDSAGGMLTEIISSADVLDDQIQASFRWQQKQQLPGGVDEVSAENCIVIRAYYNYVCQEISCNEFLVQLSFINLQSKASESSHLDKLVPNSSESSCLAPGFQVPPPQFTWNSLNQDSAMLMEGQGLSLSLSCPEAGKLGKLDIGNGELYFHGQEIRPSSNLVYSNQVQIGHVESARNMNLLRNSRYLKAAQELLDEFCSVGRAQLKNQRFNNSQDRNPNPPTSNTGSSSSKEHHSLSPSERTDYQRRKIKLLSMLEEVFLISLSMHIHTYIYIYIYVHIYI